MKRKTTCPECQGSGIEEHEDSGDYSFYITYTTDCSNCGGEGEIVALEDEDERGDWLFHKQQDDAQ